MKLFVHARDVGKAFDGRCSTERPAAAASTLIVRHGDLAFFKPVLVFWYIEIRLVFEVSLIRHGSVIPKAITDVPVIFQIVDDTLEVTSSDLI